MAIGDIVGDLATQYLTPAQRAAQLLKSRPTLGPVVRAQQQLPESPASLSNAPLQVAQSSQQSGGTKLETARPVGVMPVANSPTYPTPSQQAAQNVTPPPAAPAPQAPSRLESGYQPTGIGAGSNAIATRVGPNGVPEFTNAPASLASAMGQPVPAPSPNRSNLMDAFRAGAPGSGPQFAALGSASNLYDGVGTFSQSAPGDSATALRTFQRANDLRQGYRDQDNLKLANARLAADQSFTVVGDSSRAPTLASLRAERQRQEETQNLRDAVTGAQDRVNNRRTGIVADQQLRQSQRLEDAFQAATAPNATPDQMATYRRLTDPTGEKDQARRQAEANISKTTADTVKAQNEADAAKRKAAGLPSTLQKFEDDDVLSIGSGRTINGELSRIDGQLEDGSLRLGLVKNQLSAARNVAGYSNDNSANFASLQSTLEKLRNESLRLNSGPQTEGDAVRAWNELITNINDPKIVRQRIKEISALNDKAAANRLALVQNRRKNQGVDPLEIDSVLPPVQSQGPSNAGKSATAQSASPGTLSASTAPIPTIASKAQAEVLPAGSVFIGPDGRKYRN